MESLLEKHAQPCDNIDPTIYSAELCQLVKAVLHRCVNAMACPLSAVIRWLAGAVKRAVMPAGVRRRPWCPAPVCRRSEQNRPCAEARHVTPVRACGRSIDGSVRKQRAPRARFILASIDASAA